MATIIKTNEKPILFSTPLVQAILEGRKTQTRRVIKPQPEMFGNWSKEYPEPKPEPLSTGILWSAKVNGEWEVIKSPYGKPGDELWVRETHTFWENDLGVDHIKYKVGNPVVILNTPEAAEYVVGRFNKWRPSIHMPRWASRIQLTVADIKVEKVQDITDEDVKAEGIDLPFPDKSHFAELWDSINAKPKPVKVDGEIHHYESFPWEDVHETREHRGKPWYVYGNPYVWVVSFEVKEVRS